MDINNFISNNIFLLIIILILVLLYFKISIDKINKEQFTEIDTTDDSILKSVKRIYKADVNDIIILTNIAKDLMNDNTFEFKDKLTVKKESNFANNKLKMNIDGNIVTSGIVCVNNNLPTDKNIGVRTNKLYSSGYIATGDSNNNIKNKISNDGSVSFANDNVKISADGILNVASKVVIGEKYTIESKDGNLLISNGTGRILFIQTDRNIYFDKVGSRKDGYNGNVNGYVSNFIFNENNINLYTVNSRTYANSNKNIIQPLIYIATENNGPAGYFDYIKREDSALGRLQIKFY